MPRTIYLAVFSNGARPAHWAIFIPTPGTELAGKLIHVTGSTATGFYLEFKRRYNFATTTRRYQIVPLAQVNDQYIADTVGGGAATADTTAHDRLESAATVVQPPGRSPNPFDPAVRMSSVTQTPCLTPHIGPQLSELD